MASGSRAAAPAGREWFGHPRGLSTLFFTEMWERFSYYGMRGILILFLVAAAQTGGFGMTDERAAAIYGLYTAGVYLLALPGGWIADRILGQRNAVFLGGCIIAAGHFSMAIPTVPSFYLGLGLIVCGTGLLKPNVSAMVGDLYPEGGARRDSGFSIFYAGINTGAFIGPLICGFLGENVNWHIGFGAAGVGMVLGLIQYRRGARYLGDAGQRRTEGDHPDARSRAVRGLLIALGSRRPPPASPRFCRAPASSSHSRGSPAARASSSSRSCSSTSLRCLVSRRLAVAEKKRVVVIFIFFVASSLFWAGYEQAGSSFNLFASRLTDRMIGSGRCRRPGSSRCHPSA